MRKVILLILSFFLLESVSAQKIGVKSNVLYDAMTTMNVGVEFGIAPQWTLDISGGLNPWTFSENRKMKHWVVQPEFRWWSCRRFSGHFVGAHLLGGQFNFGGMLPWGFHSGKMFGSIGGNAILDHRYEGWGAGFGASYGYHWILGRRWGLEATLGVGYLFLKYDKYRCEKCGELEARTTGHYFGPTKVGLTLIFLIK